MKRRYHIALCLIIFLCFQLSVAAHGAERTQTYIVADGDNLWNIADRYLIDPSYWRKLQRFNRISNPWSLPRGLELAIPVRWLKRLADLALVKVIKIQGETHTTSNDNTKPKPLLMNSFLFKGDTIRTGVNGSVSLRFADGSQLLVPPDSVVAMREIASSTAGDGKTAVDLRQGRIETQVVPQLKPGNRFEIATPAGITSVRGTDFRVSAEKEEQVSRTEVLRGKVNVAGDGKTLPLGSGYGTVAAAGRGTIPPVSLLPAPEMQALPIVFDAIPMRFIAPKVSGARAYRVQIAADAAFTDMVFDRRFASEAIDAPNLPDGAYYLRVRGIDANGLEGFNGQFHFTLNARPAAPKLSKPAAGEAVQTESMDFSWAGEDTAELYHFQLARDANFRDIVFETQDCRDTSLTISEKMLPGAYYWRVAAVSEKEGFGPFSKAWPFIRMLPTPVTENPQSDD